MTDEIDENAILEAQTIADFVDRVNRLYDLRWPATIFEVYTYSQAEAIRRKVRKDDSINGYIIEDNLTFFSPVSPIKIKFVAKNLF